MSRVIISDDLTQAATGVAKDAVVAIATSLWEKAFGPMEAKKLHAVTASFAKAAQDEKPNHSDDEIKEMLAVAALILPDLEGGKIKELTADDFSSEVFQRHIGVGKNRLQPPILMEALERLRTYADLKDHRKDTFFGTDGRAHLILSITAILGRTFSLENSNKKLSWLHLSSILLEKILASSFVSTKGWNLNTVMFGGEPETFFGVLNNLQAAIKESIAIVEKDMVRRSAVTYLNNIFVEIDASRQYLRAMAGTLYAEENTPLSNGRPRPADLKSSTLIGYFVDAVGFTLRPSKTYSQDLEERKSGTVTKAKTLKIIHQPATQDYMDKIIAWASVSNDAVKDDKTDFPMGYQVPHNESKISSNESKRQKTARFLTAFKKLVADGRIKLDENGDVVLYGLKSKTTFAVKTGATELGPILQVPMGLDKAFLKTQQHASPAALAEHRKSLLELEITKAQTVNAISSFFALCGSAKKLFESYGDIYGAILLQHFFPAMQTLINAARRNQKEIEDLADLLAKSSTALGQRIQSKTMFVRRLKVSLDQMESLTAIAKKNMEDRLGEAADGTISLEKQLTKITASINNCKQLFSESGMLQVAEQSSLEGQIKAINSEILAARQLDKQIQALAKGVRDSKDRVLDIKIVDRALQTGPQLQTTTQTTAPLPEFAAKMVRPTIAVTVFKPETRVEQAGKKLFKLELGADSQQRIQNFAKLAEDASAETGRWGRWFSTSTWQSAQTVIKRMADEAIAVAKTTLIAGLNSGNLVQANANVDAAINLLQAQARKNGATAASKQDYLNQINMLLTAKTAFANALTQRNLSEDKHASTTKLLADLKKYDDQRLRALQVVDLKTNETSREGSEQLWYDMLNNSARNPLLSQVEKLRISLNEYCKDGAKAGEFDQKIGVRIIADITILQEKLVKLKRSYVETENSVLGNFYEAIETSLKNLESTANTLLEEHRAQEIQQRERAAETAVLSRSRLSSNSSTRSSRTHRSRSPSRNSGVMDEEESSPIVNPFLGASAAMFQTATQHRLKTPAAQDVIGQINKILTVNFTGTADGYLSTKKMEIKGFITVSDFVKKLSTGSRAGKFKQLMGDFKIAELSNDFENFKGQFSQKVADLQGKIHENKVVATTTKAFVYRERKVALIMMLLAGIEKFALHSSGKDQQLAELAFCAVADVANFNIEYRGSNGKGELGSFGKAIDELEQLVSETSHIYPLLPEIR